MSLFSFNQLWIALKKQWNEAVTTFEPLLPATPADPSNKFLDGNKAWSAITGFQETLVSGTNIKTINSTSLLGSGDIVISGGGEHEYDVDSVDSNTKYIGIADKGTATSATGWTVAKLVISNVGAVTETHATGIYDNRESLTYT